MATSLNDKPRTALDEVCDKGTFKRTASAFRDVISSTHKCFQPEANRYHLYISLACPWANRCYSMLHLKGLEKVVGVTIVHPTWARTRKDDPADEHCGWQFYDSSSGVPISSANGYGSFLVDKCTPDTLNGAAFVRDLYEKAGDSLKKYSVPVLWDKKLETIVNNESSDILRMLNEAFNDFATHPEADHYPPALRAEIDEVNTWVYESINNGVYKCGFAQSQEAYDTAMASLYAGLDRVEAILSTQRYLVGGRFTEADLRLFVTLVRFDEVYVGYFKTNKRQIADYPNMFNYCKEIYQLPAIRATVDMTHIKTHYYTSHPKLNYYAIVPQGPDFMRSLEGPHNRARL